MTPVFQLVATVYLTVAFLIVAGGCVYAGMKQNTDKYEDPKELVQVAIGLGLFWPLILVGGSVYLPFYALYKLGLYLGRRM